MKKRFIIPIILIISIGFMIFTYFRFPFQDNEINIWKNKFEEITNEFKMFKRRFKIKYSH